MKNLIIICSLFAVLGCKQENAFDYQFADKPATLPCRDANTQLYSEAYYAFEKAIMTQLKNMHNNPNFNVTPEYAMRNFIVRSRGNINIGDFVTKHSLKVFNELKTLHIWNGSKLLNNSEVTECLSTSISNLETRQTFNALKGAKSLAPELMLANIYTSRAKDQYKDKALMTYVALDLYYARFFELDLNNIKFVTEEDTVN